MSRSLQSPEVEGQISDHPLEGYVAKSIVGVQRLLTGERRASELDEDAHDLLTWWNETKILLDLHISRGEFLNKIRDFLVKFNLMTPTVSDKQYERLTKNIVDNFHAIDALATRFITEDRRKKVQELIDAGKKESEIKPSDIVLSKEAQELSDAKNLMFEIFRRGFRQRQTNR